MPVDIGQGASIAFGPQFGAATTATYRVTNLSWGGITRNVVDASHMLTVGGKEFVAEEVYDPGELSVEVLFDPAVSPIGLMTNASSVQAVIVTFPSGGTSTDSWSAYGYLSAFEIGVPKDEMMTGTATIKLTGNITP